MAAASLHVIVPGSPAIFARRDIESSEKNVRQENGRGHQTADDGQRESDAMGNAPNGERDMSGNCKRTCREKPKVDGKMDQEKQVIILPDTRVEKRAMVVPSEDTVPAATTVDGTKWDQAGADVAEGVYVRKGGG
jgi:hypothetical protein